MSSTSSERNPCHMCGSPTCGESMPHATHPDWVAFVAMAADPNDPWASEGSNDN